MVQTIIETMRSERADARERTPLSVTLNLLAAIFSINIVVTLVILIFSSRDLIDYDAANLFDWLNLVFEAVTLWMIWYRLKVTRPFVLAFTAFNVVVGTAVHLVMRTMDVGLQLASIIPDVVIFLYFLRSRRVREVLSEDLVLERDVLHNKLGLEQLWAQEVYYGKWYSPLKEAIDAFVASTQQCLNGTVRCKFYKGSCTVVGRKSVYSLYNEALATYGEDDAFNHQAAAGFIEINGLSARNWARSRRWAGARTDVEDAFNAVGPLSLKPSILEDAETMPEEV